MDESLLIPLEPHRFEAPGELIIAGSRERHPLSEAAFASMDRQFKAVWPRFGEVPDRVGRGGYAAYFDMFGEAETFILVVGVEGRDPAGPPEDFHRLTLPARRYVVFPHRAKVDKLRNTVWTIWHKWLPQSGCEPASKHGAAPDFIEVYGAAFNPETGEGGIEVWIPLER
jgi:AraC family transcriptional regulator